ncbi:transposase (plasmid) [Klebsiella sp. WOUb02]
MLADKGYSSQSLRDHLKIRGIKSVIPLKSNEKASRDGRRKLNVRLYKKRNVVERCFANSDNKCNARSCGWRDG